MGMHTLDPSLRLNKINEALNQTNNILLELILPKGGINPSSAVRYGTRDPITGVRDFSLQKQQGFINPAGRGRVPEARRELARTVQGIKRLFDTRQIKTRNPKIDYTGVRDPKEKKQLDILAAQRDVSLLTGGKSPEELAAQARQFAEYQKARGVGKRLSILSALQSPTAKGLAKIGIGAAALTGMAALAPISVPSVVGALVGAKTAAVGLAPIATSLGLAGLGAKGLVSGTKQIFGGNKTPGVAVPQLDKQAQIQKALLNARQAGALRTTGRGGREAPMSASNIYGQLKNNPEALKRYREDPAYRSRVERLASKADYRQDVGFAQAVTPDLLRGEFLKMQDKVNKIKSGERKLVNPIPGVSPGKSYLTFGQRMHSRGEYVDSSITPEYTASASEMKPANWSVAAKNNPDASMVRIPGTNAGKSVTQFSYNLHPEQMMDVEAKNRAAVNAALTAAYTAATNPSSPLAQTAVQSMLSGVRRSQPRPVYRTTGAPPSGVGTPTT